MTVKRLQQAKLKVPQPCNVSFAGSPQE